jgi:hypothetical protein
MTATPYRGFWNLHVRMRAVTHRPTSSFGNVVVARHDARLLGAPLRVDDHLIESLPDNFESSVSCCA